MMDRKHEIPLSYLMCGHGRNRLFVQKKKKTVRTIGRNTIDRINPIHFNKVSWT